MLKNNIDSAVAIAVNITGLNNKNNKLHCGKQACKQWVCYNKTIVLLYVWAEQKYEARKIKGTVSMESLK